MLQEVYSRVGRTRGGSHLACPSNRKLAEAGAKQRNGGRGQKETGH